MLREANRLQSALDGYRRQLTTSTFTATDEAVSVRVTVNGSLVLTRIFMKKGLLRLGAKTVARRINQALRNAQAAATAAAGDEREKLAGALGLTAEIKEQFDSVIKDIRSASAS